MTMFGGSPAMFRADSWNGLTTLEIDESREEPKRNLYCNNLQEGDHRPSTTALLSEALRTA